MFILLSWNLAWHEKKSKRGGKKIDTQQSPFGTFFHCPFFFSFFSTLHSKLAISGRPHLRGRLSFSANRTYVDPQLYTQTHVQNNNRTPRAPAKNHFSPGAPTSPGLVLGLILGLIIPTVTSLYHGSQKRRKGRTDPTLPCRNIT